LTADWESLSWPPSRLGEALDGLARHGGLEPKATAPPAGPSRLEAARTDEWVVAAADWMGLEAEPVEFTYPELEAVLLGAGPALLRRGDEGAAGPSFLLLLPSSGRAVRLLGRDFAVHTFAAKRLREHLAGHVEAAAVPGVEQLLDRASLSGRRRARTRALLLAERLAQVPIGDCWLLRHRPGERFSTQARAAGVVKDVMAFAGAHLVERLLWVASWWVIGRAALLGRLDWGWLAAWALVVLSMIPFRLAATWYQGLLAVGTGSILKKRLLQGALRLRPDEVRPLGAGHHLGRVIESEAVESLSLSGGLLAVAGAIELAIAAAVLAAGAGAHVQLPLLAVWVTGSGLLARRYAGLRLRWTGSRLALTHDLVERMIGHRTRLAQQAPAKWHEGEDTALALYLEQSGHMDRLAAWIAAVPRGWLVVGIAGLGPVFVSAGTSRADLAVSLGGILLAGGALVQLAGGFAFLIDAAIAWQQVAPLFHAAAREEPGGDPTLLPTAPALAREGAPRPTDGARPVLEASDLQFRYRERAEPVLRGCSLRLRHGDRVLLEAPSGGGKSTLVSLLNGLRSPDAGLLLLHGLDPHSWGAHGWTRRVSSAPQFHENHVITESLAFNLLMGRRWPPLAEDMEEAEAICRELGLGTLLERMPSGLLQQVGETGWQLSHGEKSRLFIARALLQGADLVVLDESFAALDPETLRQAFECAARRSPTLLVVAHP
jgi:ATP-binding cassette subfamily B protein